MGAHRILVRGAWRRHWRASIFLAVVAGLAAMVIGASFQAAGRADTSLSRFNGRNRIYDQFVQGCPPNVDPNTIEGTSDQIEQCGNPRTMTRFARVLEAVPGVEATAVATTSVVALLDPSVSNGWGRLTLLAGANSRSAALPFGHPIVVEGRVARPEAPNEIMVREAAARILGLHPGDVVRLASWQQEDLDAAVDGRIRPQTAPVRSKVVGIIRYLDDLVPSGTNTLSDATLPGDVTLYPRQGWMRAHSTDLAGYGSGVLVRLRGGPAAVPAFRSALDRMPQGWFNNAESARDVSLPALERVIDLQRHALLVFAAVAIVAGVVFVGLSTMRQLRREAAESRRLMALGLTRRDLRLVNVGRSLTIAAPACLVAVVGTVALSPLEPIGLARDLEFAIGVRVDGLVLLATVGAIAVLFLAVGALTPVETRTRLPNRAPARTSQVERALRRAGPVPLLGSRMARGRSSWAPIAVTAAAVGAVIAAGVLVASHDRLAGNPARYGAWWDVAVGQYSERGPLDAGVAKVRANPAVQAASGYGDETETASVDGQTVPLIGAVSFVGHHGPVIVRGRGPVNDREVALGSKTAATLGKQIGDYVRVVARNDRRLRLRVVGIALMYDPIASDEGAPGQGLFVRFPVLRTVSGPGVVPQSIVVRLDPGHDRAQAIASLRRDFSGSIRGTDPPVDLLNLDGIRAVPWLIAALIVVLALATLVHALVMLLLRNRTTMAVLAALGVTRRQRRGIATFATTALVLAGVVVGVPFGLAVGSRVWHAVADGIDLPSTSIVAWSTVALATFAALVVAVTVALTASWRSVRVTPSEQLRVE